jgi:hypothetical protein
MTSETSNLPVTDPTPTTSSKSSVSEDPSQTTKSPVSDAPLLAFINKFQRGFSNIEEGQQFVKELQTLRLSPPTLRAALKAESDAIEGRRPVRARKRSSPKPPQTAEDILKGLL